MVLDATYFTCGFIVVSKNNVKNFVKMLSKYSFFYQLHICVIFDFIDILQSEYHISTDRM